MDEIQAWKYLEKQWTNYVIETAFGCDTNIYGNYSSLGLCNSIMIIWCFHLITEEIKTSMMRKIPLDRPYSGYVWKLDKDGAIQRAKFCKEQHEQITKAISV